MRKELHELLGDYSLPTQKISKGKRGFLYSFWDAGKFLDIANG